jgi:dTMP kinase
VCDRFADSTRVYQGVGRELGEQRVQALHQAAFGALAPDLTLILDLDPATGMTRTHGRGEGEERFEMFELQFHTRLREGFRALAIAEPDRCVLVDACGTPDDVAGVVWRVVKERLHP